MTKRQKFVLTSLVLAGGFFTIQVSDFLFRYEAIVVIILASFLLSLWALRESLRIDATLLTLILPVLFTAGVGFFYFLLPGTLLARAPVVFLYALGMYAILLSANIYAVASLRTIALLRTAHAVGFLLTLVSAFFLFDTLLSFRSFAFFNAAVAGGLTFPLVLQNLWSIDLQEKISGQILRFSGVSALAALEISFMISLWPVTVTVGSLFLTTILYIILGITQASLQGRLFERTLREYLLVGLAVFGAVFLSAKWGG